MFRGSLYKYSYDNNDNSDIFDPKIFLRPGLTEIDIIQIKEVFDSFDTEGTGQLKPAEIRNSLIKHGFKATKNTAFHILGEYDEKQEGYLDFESFVNMCAINYNQRKDTKENIRSVFVKYTAKGENTFDIENLKKMAKDLGENVSDEILKEMIESIDGNMDGKVTFDDFYNAMTKRTH